MTIRCFSIASLTIIFAASFFAFSVPVVAQQTTVEKSAHQCQSADCKNGNCENCKSGLATAISAPLDGKADKADFQSTHTQTKTFAPEIDGKRAALSTFRIRPDGQIVACVAPLQARNAASESDQPAGNVHIYSSEFELLNSVNLPFRPSALDLDPSGNMFVAGDGRIAKLSRDGQVIAMADSPNMQGVDLEELKKEILVEVEKQREQMEKVYKQQIETFEKQIADIQQVEEEERTALQKNRLKMAKRQIKMFQQVLDQQSDMTESMIEYRIKAKSAITALAATEQDLFVATGARTGSGYEVYRTNHDLADGQRVLKNLRGCCGQMDIHAKGDKIFVAENTKFNVGIYDRDGQEVNRFGERLNKDNQGFGSCCNPMNVLCCSNGEILTAESSIGKIKRFNADGELVGYIGRARIGGGCKHVAFGHDQKLDRYYVQYEDKNQICVLTPNSENTKTESDAELTAMKQRLISGTWRLAGLEDDQSAADQDSDEDEEQMTAAIDIESLTKMKMLHFKEDGSLDFEMEQKSQISFGNMIEKWIATSVKDETLHIDVESNDDTITFRIQVKFEDADSALISVSYDGLGKQGEFREFQLSKSDSKY